jgi:Uma2 family endonuclease
MSTHRASRSTISVDDYLAGELQAEQRHEYIDGQVYAMTGASDRHGLIVNALAYAMTPAARRKGCQLFTSDMKLRLEISGKTLFYYPDLLLTCDPQDRARYFRRSPCILVEVLSESTARIDRREKLLAYQTLPSLQAYLLVEQNTQRVELYRRSNDWQVEYFEDGDVPLECLDIALPVADVYVDVESARMTEDPPTHSIQA